MEPPQSTPKATGPKVGASRFGPDDPLLDVVESIAQIGSYVLDVSSGVWTSSKGLNRLLGIGPSFVRTVETWVSLVHVADRAGIAAYFANDVLGQGLPFDREYRITRGDDGETRCVHGRGALDFDEAGRPVRMVGTIADISERKAAEDALRNSEARFRATFEQAAVGIAHLSLDGRWILVNQRLCDITGYAREQLLQMSFVDITHPDDVGSSLEALGPLLAGRLPTFTAERRYVRPDGSLVWVALTASLVLDASGAPDYLMSVTEDISARKRAEAERSALGAQLRQAQKMESVGRLAGGVAHDFNNMIGVILGNTELALEALGPDHPVRAGLLEVEGAARRSADLTRQLLAFARRQTVAPRVINLNELVGGTQDMLRRLVREGIELVWNPGANLWRVQLDPSQIDQLLLNLVVNAREAIGDIGRIAIETSNDILDDEYCSRHPGSVPGEYVVITVSDDGYGIDLETLEHIFEPFFTTKEVGEGTGLGLATVYGIVKQNAGFITADSEVGVGTTFRIYLPRFVGKMDIVREDPPLVSGVGGATLLLVEDEPAILRLGTVMLGRLGYRVIAAATPRAAIRMAAEEPGEIHLLVTDVVMPEMDGRELARSLLDKIPNLRCLFMSGYTANVIEHHGVLDKGVNFLQKPFTSAELAAAVSAALDGEPMRRLSPGE